MRVQSRNRRCLAQQHVVGCLLLVVVDVVVDDDDVVVVDDDVVVVVVLNICGSVSKDINVLKSLDTPLYRSMFVQLVLLLVLMFSSGFMNALAP